MKASFYTLGCKVNQYDTQMMTEKLERAGYEITDFEEKSDIYIINTCTVTQVSDKKSRNVISRARRKNPDAIVIVCGCFSQVSPSDASAIDGVDIVIGTKNRPFILYYIDKYLKSGKQIVDVSTPTGRESESITTFYEKTRAILKIEDGCRNFCSYCLIPFARGEIISKPIADIRAEAAAIASNGYKELVLTGIHLSSYGSDIGDCTLADAIECVAETDGIERIRLGSLEPMVVTQDFVSRIKKIDKLCPSFHLSLQSGCAKTLKAMNREYTPLQYEQSVNLLRQAFEDCAVTTDVITGFPGETDEDFEESLAFTDKIAFSKIHIFPYSVRRGTRAASMKNQVSKSVKHERLNRLSESEIIHRRAFMNSMIGKTVPVLTERCENNNCNGFSPNYIPVYFPGSQSDCNKIVDVTVISADDNNLYGIIR